MNRVIILLVWLLMAMWSRSNPVVMQDRWPLVPAPDEISSGGYYTQEDIKEVVQYASERYITFVPEIDIPGHSKALIAAYSETSCSGVQGAVYAGETGGPGENVLCAGNEENFEMLDHILDELVSLFPGKYIRIGGDEVNKKFWESCLKCQALKKKSGLKDEHELQRCFIKRVVKRDWNNFVPRMEAQFDRFDQDKVNYATSIYDPAISIVKDTNGNSQIVFTNEIDGLDVYYTFDSTFPDEFAMNYTDHPVSIPKGATEIWAITYRGGKPVGRLLAIHIKQIKRQK